MGFRLYKKNGGYFYDYRADKDIKKEEKDKLKEEKKKLKKKKF